MFLAKSSSSSVAFLPILLIFVLLYFLFLRPQQQRMRRQREQASALQIGDEVITSSGIIGRIVSFDGDRAELEVAAGVVLTVLRAAITRRADEPVQPMRRGGLAGLFAPPPQRQPRAAEQEPAPNDDEPYHDAGGPEDRADGPEA